MEEQDRPIPSPIGAQVLVRADPCRDKVGRSGLLYAPQGQEHWPNTGTVLKVGPGTWARHAGELVRVPPDVRVGDRVLFRRQPDSALIPDLREGGPPSWRDLVMLDEEFLVGVIEEE